jgi:membrane fusion protein (multidrug efflux system)
MLILIMNLKEQWFHSPATGSRFSILPPDNATGNFVKTIQRLPVKSVLIPIDVEK